MYCVLCGIYLREENQQGTVCLDCKQVHSEQERRKKRVGRRPLTACCLLIRVQYCFLCGQPYQPADASIWHASCLWSCLHAPRASRESVRGKP